MDIIGEIRSRWFPQKGAAQKQVRLTALESLAVDPVAALDCEMTRSGRRFNGIGIAAGAAPVQAIPTTTAGHLLYNPDTSRAYVLDMAGAYLLSGTATAGLTLYGIVTPVTATLPTAATGSLISSASYTGGASSKSLIASAYTIPTPASNAQWFCLGSSVGGVPGVGGGYAQNLTGRIIIPPLRAFGMSVMAGTGTSPLYVPYFTWHEVEHDLE